MLPAAYEFPKRDSPEHGARMHLFRSHARRPRASSRVAVEDHPVHPIAARCLNGDEGSVIDRDRWLPPDGGEGRAADTRASIANDRLRIRELTRLGPDSPEAVTFQQHLLEYGIGTLLTLCFAGVLPGKLKELVPTLQLEPPPSCWGEDHWRNVVITTVASAVAPFLEDLLDGAWRPERGASIKTYFVNTCCLTLVDEYRKEIRRLKRAGGAEEVLGGTVAELEPYVFTWLIADQPLPSQTALDRDQIRTLLAMATHRDIPRIVYLLAQGYSQREVALLLGRSEQWLSKTLKKFREAVRKWRSA